MLRQRPWVRLKIAASLDGRTALENGQSQWITGEAARTDGHAWRARSCALLTGIGTVLEDDPQLDVRLLPCDRQPALVVVDSRLQTPLAAKLFRPQRSLLIYSGQTDSSRAPDLQALGATVIPCPSRRRVGKKWIWRPCCATWQRARSTSCMLKPATNSMVLWYARAWSMSFWCIWHPSCWDKAATWLSLGL